MPARKILKSAQDNKWIPDSGELDNHVGLSVHVEDEDDEKYVFQMKLNHSKCCWTAGSNFLSCAQVQGV